MDQKENNGMVLDIKEIFYILLDHILIILLLGILLAFCAGLGSKLLLNPIYTSSSSLYIINRQDAESTTLADLQTGIQLTKDYQILVKSRPVMEQVISDLNLDLSYEQLAGMITVSAPVDTSIIEIVVNNRDAYTAKKLVDEIAKVSAERIVNIMDMDKVNIISEGNLPTQPSSPNVFLNILVCGFLGIVLSSFLIILEDIFNDTIKNSEDIERYLGLVILSEIPLEEGIKTKKSRGEHYAKKT